MPENTISQQEFDHLVQLAALQLDETQKEYLRQELNHQLNAIRELESIPVEDDLPITTHGVTYDIDSKADLRDDVCETFTHAQEIIDQAPQTEEDYLSVPDIPHTTLE